MHTRRESQKFAFNAQMRVYRQHVGRNGFSVVIAIANLVDKQPMTREVLRTEVVVASLQMPLL